MGLTSRIFLVKTAAGLLLILTSSGPHVAAQLTAPQNAQGSQTPQAPGGGQDAGGPAIISEGQVIATATGAQTHVLFTVLHRDPTDLEHATDPLTGRNFNWDPTSNRWVDSASGKRYAFAGYLCSTGSSSAVTGTSITNPIAPQSAQGSQTPQAPGGGQDAGGPAIISEGQVITTAGAQTQVLFTVLHRNPTDLEHATDPLTGRNFNWEPASNRWVDSASGKSYAFAGYLCSTSGSSSTPSVQQTPPSPQIPQTNNPPPTTGTTAPASHKSVSMSGFTPSIQLRGFGGASFVNGNTPGTAGFDGAVLFPLGNRVLVGPTAGFQWVNSSLVKTIGGGPPPSTFIHTSAGFKQGNFGGQIGFNLSGFQLGIRGGATVAGSTITQALGFCGTGGPTAPAGCHTLSTTTTHDTVVGPFVGGYISHSIFSHVGIFVDYDYTRLKDTSSSGTFGISSGSQTIFDIHYNQVTGGFNVTFGRHARR